MCHYNCRHSVIYCVYACAMANAERSTSNGGDMWCSIKIDGNGVEAFTGETAWTSGWRCLDRLRWPCLDTQRLDCSGFVRQFASKHNKFPYQHLIDSIAVLRSQFFEFALTANVPRMKINLHASNVEGNTQTIITRKRVDLNLNGAAWSCGSVAGESTKVFESIE